MAAPAHSTVLSRRGLLRDAPLAGLATLAAASAVTAYDPLLVQLDRIEVARAAYWADDDEAAEKTRWAVYERELDAMETVKPATVAGAVAGLRWLFMNMERHDYALGSEEAAMRDACLTFFETRA